MTQLAFPGQLVVTEPQGVSCLPLVQLDKATVRAKHKSVLLPKAQRSTADCSYGAFGQEQLQFTAWEMFHAAKKTELTRTFTQRRAEELGLLMAHEHHDRFVWDTKNFRCADGSGLWLEDFSGTGLAGRIGEAIAYLTMVKWGYVYWDRVATVWLRAAQTSQIQHSEMVKMARYTGLLNGGAFDLQPDFVFEKQDGTTSLMEAKGSFVAPLNDRPDVKGPLKRGLEQLDAWASLILPPPSSSIAIGTFIREEGDSSRDPSLILHVDPPPSNRPDVRPVAIPPDQIRRGNYGVWLAGMGYRQSGSALIARRETRTTRLSMPVATINGRKFALSIQGWRANRRRGEPWLWWLFELMHMPWRQQVEIARNIGIGGVYAVGLETSILRAVGRAIAKPHASILTESDFTPQVFNADGQREGGFFGSVMPDGSLMGVISRELIGGMQMEEFAL